MIKQEKFYSLSVDQVVKKFNTNIKEGLSREDVLKLQKKYGENSFEKKDGLGIFGRILNQLKSPLMSILFVAGIFTIVLQEYTDAFVIFLSLSINMIIGTFQENKASEAFDKLNESQEKYATVIRSGKKSIILVKDLTLGDIIILEPGMYVPADIRLIEEKNLLVNESSLTGEWVNVVKNLDIIKKETSLSDQSNMLWMGTFISAGTGRGIITTIGNDTQIGKIATSLSEIEEEKTPIKKNIEKLARFLSFFVIAALLIIFVIGILRGESPMTMLLVAIAVAIAVIPEGLPAAVTSVLAVGMSAILKKGGLVRNLLAAETLGSTTIILTDKTGTITMGKMHLSEIFTADSIKTNYTEMKEGDNKILLEMAVMSSDAFVEEGEDAPDKLTVRGRPIEKAIVVAGLEIGTTQEELSVDGNRLDLLTFESRNGFSVSLNKNSSSKKNILYINGIPELILEKSTYYFENGKEKKMSKNILNELKKIQKTKSLEGIRFTALAYKKTTWDKIPENEKKKTKTIADNLVFVGLLAFSDPVRPNVKESISKVKGAGAKVIMMTGDNPNTASKIAEEVGIIKKGDQVMIGMELEKLSDKELLLILKKVKVFARMIPSQKLRISKILQKDGEVVAMTGDGINDAPALQSADIGIAMGNATEVSKEASDLILLDGDFSVITYAIEEGRKIIDNLKKIVGYLLSTGFSEVFLIGGSLIAGLPLPILPTQILWANIIEEGLMNFAFVFEPGEKDLMKRDPRSIHTKNILTPKLKHLIKIVGIITGVFLMLLYIILLQFNLAIEEVRTIMFVALSIDSIFFAFSFKALDKPLWKEKIFSNIYLVFSLMISISFLLIAMFFPPIRNLLSLTILTGFELLLLAGIGIFNLFLIETTKYFIFERKA